MSATKMTSNPKRNFYEVYDTYYERIRSVVRSAVKDEWVAEDLTQDTFVRAHRNIDTLKDHTKIKPWLFRIARNVCQDYFRMAGNPSKNPIPLDDDTKIDSRSKPEQMLEQHQMSTCVQKQMLRLSSSLRPVLRLYYVKDLSHREIAGALGISIENVKIRLHRARKQMKSILNQNCRFERDNRDVLVCEPKNQNRIFS